MSDKIDSKWNRSRSRVSAAQTPSRSQNTICKNTANPVTTVLIWCVFACAVMAPVLIAATSPLLSSREGVYIIGGMAGIVALALLLVQPLLASGYLPGISTTQKVRWHLCVGKLLVLTIALHIGGLYLTSPDDLTDALLLVAPTPFSVYGVIGMWAVIATAILVTAKSRIKLSYTTWHIAHNALAVIVVVCSVVHALMIEGAMNTLSKWFLCMCIALATTIVILHLRVIGPLQKKRASKS